MNISIFDVAGPVMIGPSSSHTAGAVRLGRMAAQLIGTPFCHVSFGLHGSFAKTCRGHGTDLALVAGVLGIFEDDERIADAFGLAKERGISWDFYLTELKGMHENSVCIRFTLPDHSIHEIVGSSIGGGRILIRRFEKFDTEFSLNVPTIIALHDDCKGVIGHMATVLADYDINIGIMRLSRRAKGDVACCVMEADQPISPFVTEALRQIEHVILVRTINPFLEDDNVSEF